LDKAKNRLLTSKLLERKPTMEGKRLGQFAVVCGDANCEHRFG
jgi:hypothetical protein